MGGTEARLRAIAEQDITGGLKVADCRHGPQPFRLVLLPSGMWQLVLSDNVPAGGSRVFHLRVFYCPVCGIDLHNVQTRNYIMGEDIPSDEILLIRCNAFAPIEAAIAEKNVWEAVPEGDAQ